MNSAAAQDFHEAVARLLAALPKGQLWADAVNACVADMRDAFADVEREADRLAGVVTAMDNELAAAHAELMEAVRALEEAGL